MKQQPHQATKEIKQQEIKERKPGRRFTRVKMKSWQFGHFK